MIKAVSIGFGIIILLMLTLPIPLVHLVIPFGPFIGGYYGITAATDSMVTPGRKALIFGIWIGTLMGLILVISASVLTVVGFEKIPYVVIWILVWVFTFYYGSMAGLGAWYSELKAKG